MQNSLRIDAIIDDNHLQMSQKLAWNSQNSTFWTCNGDFKSSKNRANSKINSFLAQSTQNLQAIDINVYHFHLVAFDILSAKSSSLSTLYSFPSFSSISNCQYVQKVPFHLHVIWLKATVTENNLQKYPFWNCLYSKSTINQSIFLSCERFHTEFLNTNPCFHQTLK